MSLWEGLFQSFGVTNGYAFSCLKLGLLKLYGYLDSYPTSFLKYRMGRAENSRVG